MSTCATKMMSTTSDTPHTAHGEQSAEPGVYNAVHGGQGPEPGVTNAVHEGCNPEPSPPETECLDTVCKGCSAQNEATPDAPVTLQQWAAALLDVAHTHRACWLYTWPELRGIPMRCLAQLVQLWFYTRVTAAQAQPVAQHEHGHAGRVQLVQGHENLRQLVRPSTCANEFALRQTLATPSTANTVGQALGKQRLEQQQALIDAWWPHLVAHFDAQPVDPLQALANVREHEIEARRTRWMARRLHVHALLKARYTHPHIDHTSARDVRLLTVLCRLREHLRACLPPVPTWDDVAEALDRTPPVVVDLRDAVLEQHARYAYLPWLVAELGGAESTVALCETAVLKVCEHVELRLIEAHRRGAPAPAIDDLVAEGSRRFL